MAILSGTYALITGASRGIGLATARTLAMDGCHPILVARKRDSLDQVQGELKKDGLETSVLACHMGDLGQFDGLVEEIRSITGGVLDYFVNNAATNPFFGPLSEIPEEAYDKTFEVNLKGPFFLCQKLLPLLKSSKNAPAIVHVSSINGLKPPENQGVYSMTKAALIAMTSVQARELGGFGIRVHSIAPGLIETKFARALTEDEGLKKGYTDATALGRTGQPEEVAALIKFLLSSESSYMTGSVVRVDGGFLS